MKCKLALLHEHCSQSENVEYKVLYITMTTKHNRPLFIHL